MYGLNCPSEECLRAALCNEAMTASIKTNETLLQQQIQGIQADPRKPRQVVAAMSGGVDSSVAAYLMKQAGVEVIGVTLRLRPCSEDQPEQRKACCGAEDSLHARVTASRIGIDHYFLDYQKEFFEEILTTAWKEYSRGRTPNPCVLCNRFLKFGRLVQYAEQIGADGIVTGHYARILPLPDREGIGLFRGIDPVKDQSYFLFLLTQKQLSKIVFPLGNYTKQDVKNIAKQHRIDVYQKPESQDFIRGDRFFLFDKGTKPGEIIDIKSGEFSVDEPVCRVKTQAGSEEEIKLFQVWPVRRQRRVKERMMPDEPLVTGQRILDTLFPLAKGGTACVPGPFGSGKTVVQHQLAKWSDAQIIVYVACGERGNEVADLLLSFPELKDPSTGRPLMERTIIIANTSNMPVAAREASIYTGITIAEYFRDMGYSVALMADSSSRWAEALREIGGRMEEMPGDEGYPAYLASRLAEFYERAGKVVCLGSDQREGALSVIGAVSPPGGDLSDPVVLATLKVVKVFWALDDQLANMRHFPAINWLQSYSLYRDSLKKYMAEKVAEDFTDLSQEALKLLEMESELQEIARLIGVESLSFKDRLVLETARSIREDFLHQNAYHPQDTYTPLRQQYLMLRNILYFHQKANQALDEGLDFKAIVSLDVREQLARMKYFEQGELALLEVQKQIDASFQELSSRG